MITNDAGLVIAQHDYLPFGTAFGQPQPSAHQPRGFAGKEFDPETGSTTSAAAISPQARRASRRWIRS